MARSSTRAIPNASTRRMRRSNSKLASRPKRIEPEHAAFVIQPPSRTASRQTPLRYDERASGATVYAYVGDNPISFVDPWGLKLCSTTLSGLGSTYMDSNLYPMVQNWLSANSAAGISVTFTSAFRTTAHQASLGAGAITPAAPGHSLHEAGFAGDISWSSLSSADQSIVLQNADAAGLSWGGNFSSPDPVHFYNDPGNRTQYIQAAQKDYQNGSASACKCGS